MALRLATRQARLVVFGYNAVTSRIEWVRSPVSPQYAGSPLSLSGGQVMAYYKDGNGVVRECSYYDRGYARQNVKVTPPSMVSVFFPYSCSGILDLVNHELCCNFTHIIVTSGIDIDSDTTPLCGSV